ncbi:MAG TPA: DUF447 domain-containing protein [Methylovirgula sp.]|nr:DUF447 domain-containing protein [Methylovirgula sp.]
MIREVIVTTADAAGKVHIAPFGLISAGEDWIIAPFRPSTTLDNLAALPFAVANYTDDVRIFAGSIIGRRDWPLAPIAGFPVPRLAGALAHAELSIVRTEDDPQRPRFFCRVLRRENHAPFEGLNRAKAAVLELAVLVSRLDFLPREKIEGEIAYLKIAIEKTAGPDEAEAWSWLMEKVSARLSLD